MGLGTPLAEVHPFLSVSEVWRLRDAALNTRLSKLKDAPAAYPEVWQGARVLLEVRDLHVSYGQVEALHGVDLDVRLGEVVVLLGANGAGKSTTANAISGLLRPTSGSINFDSRSLLGLEPNRVVAAGISQVPQGRRVFPRQTVIENLKLGAYSRRDAASVRKDIEDAFGRFPILGRRRDQLAGTLSGGEQQMLAISRALVARPRLLILDEPSVGLAPVVTREIVDTIRLLNRAGTTILLIEQLAFAALDIADRAYVLDRGRVALSGTAAEVRDAPGVQAAYLG